VIENLLAVSPPRTVASFYRTSAGAEIDLVLDLPGQKRWAIEIRRGLSARPGKGFHLACEDIAPTRRLLVHAGEGVHPVSTEIEALGVRDLATQLAALWP
jgi:hypothetical protein